MTKMMRKMMKTRRTRKKNHQKWMKKPLLTKSPKSQNPKKRQEKGPKVYPLKVIHKRRLAVKSFKFFF